MDSKLFLARFAIDSIINLQGKLAMKVNQPQGWRLEGRQLFDALKSLHKFYSIADKLEIARLCGYFNDEKIILIKLFEEAVSIAEAQCKDRTIYDIELYKLINGRLCYTDSNNGGDVFITKKVWESDYDCDDCWDEVTVDYLKSSLLCKEAVAKEQLDSLGFTEPMMTTPISCMLYADTDDYEPVEDKDLMECNGIDIDDLHLASNWGDG